MKFGNLIINVKVDFDSKLYVDIVTPHQSYQVYPTTSELKELSGTFKELRKMIRTHKVLEANHKKNSALQAETKINKLSTKAEELLDEQTS